MSVRVARERGMEFRILGPIEVVEGDHALALGGSRQRALLALLLTSANQVVSAERLIDELWGATPPGSAANALHYHVSRLRKTLGPDRIVTREPGYLIRVGPDELDLLRFERLSAEAAGVPPEAATGLLRKALALWYGPPLADLEHESFAQAEIRRLEELRLGALERQIDARLALGEHDELVPDLAALRREHPFREQLTALLMRALYAAGRQAEALAVYRETREALVETLGIEPGPSLQELERAVLRQDAGLSAPSGAAAAASSRSRGAIVVVAAEEAPLDGLLEIAEPLARRPGHEIIVARLIDPGGDLASASTALAERRVDLGRRGVSARVVAYTTPDRASDISALVTENEVDLVLVAGSDDLLDDGRLDRELAGVLEGVPCDVGVVVGPALSGSGPVIVPFGGADHEWSAIELAAWLADSLGMTLRLLGTEADPAAGRRDASRLLARASLLVQRVVGIVTEPVLVPAGGDSVVAAAAEASLLVIGLSDRWRSEGLGPMRAAVASGAGVLTVFVRRGPRPSGVAPSATLTRFTWTLESGAPEPPAARRR
jgi:DNA-binding SARP family transcriptional activator